MDIDPDEFAEQIDYLGILGKLVVPRALEFVEQSILFTGNDPFGAEELSGLLPERTDCYIDYDVPEDVSFDLVVVGQTDFSEEAIASSLDRGGGPPRFLPQEGFLDELLFGHDWWDVDVEWLNAVLEYHPGLQYVKALETFPWPGTDAPEAPVAGASAAEYQSETALYRLGYRITGRSRAKRWQVLESTAVPKLGLQEVAETIARHCRTRKRQIGGKEKYAHALAEWEHDLGRLKREFYKGHRARFVWPRSEP